jgi:SgrR family transcriptional regulator
MHYELTLYQKFEQHVRTETTIDTLAELWDCSSRHAKTQIQALHQQQVVQWETLRGRGKKPFITLLRDKIDVLTDTMQALWKKSKYEEAIQLAQEMELLTHPQIQRWLNVQFGLQIENDIHVFRQVMYYVELCLDPLKALSRHDMHILEQIHESLFSIDEKGNTSGNLLFHVHTDDFQQWQFILRKGILFHNLQEVTASDVVVSLLRAAPFYTQSFQFVKVEEIDRYEIHITLAQPCSLLPHFLASTRFAIVPASGESHIGCGAFTLTEHNDVGIKLQTFNHYFKQRPWIDVVEIVYSNQFQVDTIRYEPFNDPSIPNRKIMSQEQGAEYVALNGRYGALKDEQKRAYIWHLIQQEAYIVDPSSETIAHSWMMDSEPIQLSKLKQNPIFTQPLTIGFQQIREGVSHEHKAKILQEQLAKEGIQSTLQCINFKEKLVDLNRQIDVFVGGIALGNNVFASLISIYLAQPQMILNFLEPANAEYVCARLQAVTEQNVNMAIFKEIEQFIQTNYTVKFLTHRQHIFYVREDTSYKHVQFDQHGRIDYRRMYLSKGK